MTPSLSDPVLFCIDHVHLVSNDQDHEAPPVLWKSEASNQDAAFFVERTRRKVSPKVILVADVINLE